MGRRHHCVGFDLIHVDVGADVNLADDSGATASSAGGRHSKQQSTFQCVQIVFPMDFYESAKAKPFPPELGEIMDSMQRVADPVPRDLPFFTASCE